LEEYYQNDINGITYTSKKFGKIVHTTLHYFLCLYSIKASM